MGSGKAIVFLIELVIKFFIILFHFFKFLFVGLYRVIKRIVDKKGYEKELAEADKKIDKKLKSDVFKLPPFRSDPLFRKLFDEALEFMEEKMWKEALDLLDKIMNKEVDTGGRTLIESDEMYAQALLHKALCYISLGGREDCIKILEGEELGEKIKQIQEGEYLTYFYLVSSNIYKKLGDEGRKLKMVETALGILLVRSCSNKGELFSLCFQSLFSHCLEKEDWESMIAYAQRAITIQQYRYVLFLGGKHYCLALKELGREDELKKIVEALTGTMKRIKMGRPYIKEIGDFLKESNQEKVNN